MHYYAIQELQLNLLVTIESVAALFLIPQPNFALLICSLGLVFSGFAAISII
jgi:hypothetical protein